METKNLLEQITKLLLLEEHLPEYRRVLSKKKNSQGQLQGFGLSVMTGTLEFSSKGALHGLFDGFKVILHTWSEHPHNGSIYDQQQKEITTKEALDYLETAIVQTRAEVKEHLKKKLLDEMVERELTSKGL
jgi:hypothetical protein